MATKKRKSRTAKKPARTARKAVKKAAKKAKAPVRKAAKKPAKAKKPAPRKKKQTKGEGDYAASRAFDRDQAGFVKKNKAKIPALGRQAEMALDGPEGEVLRAAEAAGLARSRDMF